MGVSRETQERLEILAALIQKWSPSINLVSRDSLTELWTRHIADSLQLITLAEPSDRWCDLGSGGGFPGLVVAACDNELSLSDPVNLVESDSRKAVFLRTAIREMEVNANVHIERIENLNPLDADVISARALAPLDKLLEFQLRHGTPDGTALFPKGRSWQTEVEAARRVWSFDLTVHPSQTQSDAVILEIKKVEHV